MPIARFRHVAIPRLMLGNQMGIAWSKRPVRPARWIRSGGCNRGVEQVWEREHKGMTAAPRRAALLKLHGDVIFWRAELVTSEARPMPFGKKREKHRRGAAGYRSKRLYKDCGDNVGKGHLPRAKEPWGLGGLATRRYPDAVPGRAASARKTSL